MPKGEGQLYLFNYDPTPEPKDSVILFHLPQETKDNLATQARLQGLSLTKLLNNLISNYISQFKQEKPAKKKTGRGNIDWLAVEKTKELMRAKHPEGVRLMDIAEYIGCSSARARGIIDLLSGANEHTDFLVWEDYEKKPVLYYIYRDTEMN